MMARNDSEETSNDPSFEQFCSSKKSLDIYVENECESEHVSNILTYKKIEINSESSETNPDSEEPAFELPINNSFRCNVDIEENYGLSAFPDIIKPNNLEDISEEQLEVREGDPSTEEVKCMKDEEEVDLTKSSEIHVTNIAEQVNNLDIAQEVLDEAIPKYSPSFLNHQEVQEELFQQNALAQELLLKYYRELQDDNHGAIEEVENNKKSSSKTLTLLQNVSSVLHRFSQFSEEKASFKPSEMYVYYNESKTQTRPSRLRFINSLKYHRNFMGSLTNVSLEIPLDSCCRIKCSYSKNMSSVQDTIEDLRNSSSENIQFLNTKFTNSSHNRILYKNDSLNLENSFSEDDFIGWNCPVLSERYLSLRNLYSYSYMENSKSRYQFQTLPKAFGLFGGVDFKVSDEEYKLWLKQNDFVKYTDYSITSDTSFSSRKSFPDKLVGLSTSQTSGKLAIPGFNISSQHSRKQLNYMNYVNLYQFIIYEHIVISNCVHFFSYHFFAKRLKKLSICDRIVQLLFFIMCYYVIVFLNDSGIKNMGEKLTYKNVFK